MGARRADRSLAGRRKRLSRWLDIRSLCRLSRWAPGRLARWTRSRLPRGLACGNDKWLIRWIQRWLHGWNVGWLSRRLAGGMGRYRLSSRLHTRAQNGLFAWLAVWLLGRAIAGPTTWLITRTPSRIIRRLAFWLRRRRRYRLTSWLTARHVDRLISWRNTWMQFWLL